MKQCRVCGVKKPPEDFIPCRTTKDGTRNKCRICHRIYQAEIMRKRRQAPEIQEKARLAAKTYREKNRELILHKNKEWLQKRYSEKPELSMYYAARRRAKLHGVPFDLTPSDIKIPSVCPILGIPLVRNVHGVSLRNSASLDRIVPSLGYVRGNIVVVSHKANTIKNDATPEEILAVGNFYADIKRKTSVAV